MLPEQEYQDAFKENNMELAINLRELVGKTVNRAHELVNRSRSLTDLSSAMKIAETAGKITGIVKEEDVVDLTVNQISGFTFVQINNNSSESPKELENKAMGQLESIDAKIDEENEEDAL